MKKLTLLFILLFNLNSAIAQQNDSPLCIQVQINKQNLINLKAQMLMLESELNFAEEKVNTEGRAAESASGAKVIGYLFADLFIVEPIWQAISSKSEGAFWAASAAALTTLGLEIYSVNSSLREARNLKNNRDAIKLKLSTVDSKIKSEEFKISQFEKQYCLVDSTSNIDQTVSADDAIKTETAVTEALIISSFKARNAKSASSIK